MTFSVNGLSVDAPPPNQRAAGGWAGRARRRHAANDGSILATEVKPADTGLMPGELEIRGSLDSLTATQAVVSGLAFDISIAEIQTGLLVGNLDKVHASLSPTTNTWIAREIALFIRIKRIRRLPSAAQAATTGTLRSSARWRPLTSTVSSYPVRPSTPPTPKFKGRWSLECWSRSSWCSWIQPCWQPK